MSFIDEGEGCKGQEVVDLVAQIEQLQDRRLEEEYDRGREAGYADGYEAGYNEAIEGSITGNRTK
jgi:flagellar biosynthesis/type III secretory pathway protein FliH